MTGYRKPGRRALAMLLAIAMCFGLLGTTAFAVEDHIHDEDGWTCVDAEGTRTLDCVDEDREHDDGCYAVTEGKWACTAPEAMNDVMSLGVVGGSGGTTVDVVPAKPADDWVQSQCGVVVMCQNGNAEHTARSAAYGWISGTYEIGEVYQSGNNYYCDLVVTDGYDTYYDLFVDESGDGVAHERISAGPSKWTLTWNSLFQTWSGAPTAYLNVRCEMPESAMHVITLTYHANDGSGRTAVKEYEVEVGGSEMVTLRNPSGAQVVDPDSYDSSRWLGWSVDPDSSAGEYGGGDDFTFSEDVDLYAIWKESEPASKTVYVIYATAGSSGLRGTSP